MSSLKFAETPRFKLAMHSRQELISVGLGNNQMLSIFHWLNWMSMIFICFLEKWVWTFLAATNGCSVMGTITFTWWKSHSLAGATVRIGAVILFMPWVSGGLYMQSRGPKVTWARRVEPLIVWNPSLLSSRPVLLSWILSGTRAPWLRNHPYTDALVLSKPSLFDRHVC